MALFFDLLPTSSAACALIIYILSQETFQPQNTAENILIIAGLGFRAWAPPSACKCAMIEAEFKKRGHTPSRETLASRAAPDPQT